MIIYGWRRRVAEVAMLTLMCQRCQTPAAHALRRSVTKVTLFYIPLFPISSKYFTQCTFCGATVRIGKEQAQQLQDQQQTWNATQAQQYGGYPAQQAMGGYPAQAQQIGYPGPQAQAQQIGYPAPHSPQAGFPAPGQIPYHPN